MRPLSKSIQEPTFRGTLNVCAAVVLCIFGLLLFGEWLLIGAAMVGTVYAARWAVRQDRVDRLDRTIAEMDAVITEDDQAHEVNRFRETLDDTLNRILRRQE